MEGKTIRNSRRSNTGFKGIHTHKKGGFEARFNYKGKYEYLGKFNTLVEAVNARKEYIFKLM